MSCDGVILDICCSFLLIRIVVDLLLLRREKKAGLD
jgi:hypothetical protein